MIHRLDSLNMYSVFNELLKMEQKYFMFGATVDSSSFGNV